MLNFATYYRTKFREDINQFFSTIPDQSKFHGDNQQTYTIQYERLTKDFDNLNFLTDDKINFGVALFFTVLTDMVCYTHFKEEYEKFRGLTLYPKLIGNCPGGCHYHYHPSDIFTAINYSRSNGLETLYFKDKFNEAIPTMKNEIKEFFKSHLTDIDEQVFWDRCLCELPYQLN